MISNRMRIGRIKSVGKRRWRAAVQSLAEFRARSKGAIASWSAEHQFRFGTGAIGKSVRRDDCMVVLKRRCRAAVQSPAEFRARSKGAIASWSAERQFRFGTGAIGKSVRRDDCMVVLK